jgi:uncharacterized metal-binding protein
MPNGRTHELINLTALGLLSAGFVYSRSQGALAELEPLLTADILSAFTVSYLLGTFLVTPDLDLAENQVRAKDHWGLFGLLWEPYGLIFKHRGLSHSWFVGPLTRLVYLALLVFALLWSASFVATYLGTNVSVHAKLVSNWQALALGSLLGYYLSQWLHLIADGVSPDHGLQLRRRRR